jgi:hypothetical protein
VVTAEPYPQTLREWVVVLSRDRVRRRNLARLVLGLTRALLPLPVTIAALVWLFIYCRR